MHSGDSQGVRQLAEELARRGALTQDVVHRAQALQPVEVGTSPHETFLSLPPLSVRRYRSERGGTPGHPVLLVYSMINRPYLLDLQPRRSVIRRLTEAGFDAYLLDWGEPTAADSRLRLDAYLGELLDAVVTSICAEHGVEAINLVGVCQGGTFSACYSALRPERVRTLATLATPIDFHTPDNTLWKLVRDVDIDALTQDQPTIASGTLNPVFIGLKPFRLLDQRYFQMPLLCGDDESLADFLRMERWMYDSPNQPTEAFRQFVKTFYQDNQLARGRLELAGQRVELTRLRMPVFNVFARGDHLIPPAAARALADLAGTADYTEHAFPGGHLGLFVSSKAHRELYPDYVTWALARQ